LFSISSKTSWICFCSKFRLSSRCLAAWLLLAHLCRNNLLHPTILLIPFNVCYPGSMSWCNIVVVQVTLFCKSHFLANLLTQMTASN
ncbi:hypothetical protein BDQ17DRAFT_1359766, partial [Cyathus striatus]